MSGLYAEPVGQLVRNPTLKTGAQSHAENESDDRSVAPGSSKLLFVKAVQRHAQIVALPTLSPGFAGNFAERSYARSGIVAEQAARQTNCNFSTIALPKLQRLPLTLLGYKAACAKH